MLTDNQDPKPREQARIVDPLAALRATPEYLVPVDPADATICEACE